MNRLICFWVLLISCIFAKVHAQTRFPVETTGTKKKLNVILIAVDDLKPQLGSYGYKEIKTPYIDRLAGMGTTFKANYCQQAVCAPSRASFLSGLYPDFTQVYDLQTQIRAKNPQILTMPQHFKNEGYVTWGIGKIFDRRSVDSSHDEVSWSEPYGARLHFAKGFAAPVFSSYQSQDTRNKVATFLDSLRLDRNTSLDDLPLKRNDISFLMPSTECVDVPDNAYEDGAITDAFIEKLKDTGENPFFYAIGFVRPHLPFVAPQKYWNLYNRNLLELEEPQSVAGNIPTIALHNAGELKNGYNDIAAEVIDGKQRLLLTEKKQRELIHGYYAGVSYIDAQVGKILNAVEKLKLLDNTIIVLFGDHGFHLGDHTLWCKHSNFEQATRSPLIIYAPGVTTGTKYEQPTEHISVFPTLCDLSGITKPTYLSGESLLPALENSGALQKKFAISQYPRSSGTTMPKRDDIMGYTIRTMRFRYTEWIKNDFTTRQPYNPKDVIAAELYDYELDSRETKNLVNDRSKKSIVQDLQKELHLFFEQQKKKVEVYNSYSDLSN